MTDTKTEIDWVNGPFCEKDFPGNWPASLSSQEAARAANTRFRELLKDAPVVYSRKQKTIGGYCSWDPDATAFDTHTARLVDIREIK